MNRWRANASLIALAALVPACTGSETQISLAPDRCDSKECLATPPPEPAALVVENRTGGTIDLRVRESSLLVDGRILDGTFGAPIPDAVVGEERSAPLHAGETRNVNATVVIVERQAGQLTGGVLRVGDGPPFLAVGFGKLLVRTGDDGKPFFEPEDPKAVSLVRADGELPACEPGAIIEEAPFDDAPEAMRDAYVTSRSPYVRHVTRDDKNCRILEIATSQEEESVGEIRACIPDSVWPFADGAIIHVSIGEVNAGSFMNLRAGDGTYLDLVRIGFEARTFNALPDLVLAFDPEPTCARINPSCGDVDVPARITARVGEQVAQRVAFGEPLADIEANRVAIVLAAKSHPVRNLACGKNERFPHASAWLVNAVKM